MWSVLAAKFGGIDRGISDAPRQYNLRIRIRSRKESRVLDCVSQNGQGDMKVIEKI